MRRPAPIRAASFLAALLLAALALTFSPAAAKRLTIDEYQELDQRVQDVGWKLARGNAEFCANPVPSVGLTLQDAASYSRPEEARAALGIKGSFAVQTAARGSPAAASQAFARYREISAIGSLDPNQWSVTRAKKNWVRLDQIHDWIEQELRTKGRVTFRFADGGEEALEPVAICPTRFETFINRNIARADGSRVKIGSQFPGFAWEEPIFAGVIAHELAHNLLGHTEWLDRNKRKRKHVRLTEREADRLMPWLMANAGYDPQDAVRFMTTWGKKHDPGLFRSGGYEGWDERAEHIAAEVPLVRALMEREGKADWSVHFRREIDPDQGLPKADTENKDVAKRD